MLSQLRYFFIDKQFAKKRDFLKTLSICSGLSNGELGILLKSFHSRTYQEGETIFLEGDIGRALFVVESGRVELSKTGQNGERQRLAALESGSFFGEMALLEQLPRSASAVALEETTLLLLYRSKIDEILESHPRIGVNLMTHLARLLSARLRKTSSDLSALIVTAKSPMPR